MKTLSDQLVQYAGYHRDARNIATHFVGIPLIVLAMSTLLSRPHWYVGNLPCSPAIALAITFSVYYLSLDLRLGAVMSVFMALVARFGWWSAELDTLTWFTVGVAGFLVGWTFQLVGHMFEGRKPAFVDDLISLAIGPLFVLVEAAFQFDLLTALQSEIEQRAGAVRKGGAQTP